MCRKISDGWMHIQICIRPWDGIIFNYVADSLLPISFSSIGKGGKERNGYAYLPTSTSNWLDISKPQEELLLRHGILGHYNIRNAQRLMGVQGPDQTPMLATTVPGVNTCTLPLCSSCLRGKGKLTSVNSKRSTYNLIHIDVIKKGNLKPGMSISTDQYECRVRGRFPHTKGKEDPLKMYEGDTLFGDHTSGWIRVYNQVSLGESDTLRSKHAFELEGEASNHMIRHYHSDNGVYTSKYFKEDLAIRHQVVIYSGVGVHG